MIALFVSKFNESSQARDYQIASIETVENEVEENHNILKGVIDKQTRLLDTIKTYISVNITIRDLVAKSSGITMATLSNTGLEFYKRNQINSIDFEMMTYLIQMNTIAELINSKFAKLTDFLYPKIFADSKESKTRFILHLADVLESETQLINMYEKFIEDYINANGST